VHTPGIVACTEVPGVVTTDLFEKAFGDGIYRESSWHHPSHLLWYRGTSQPRYMCFSLWARDEIRRGYLGMDSLDGIADVRASVAGAWSVTWRRRPGPDRESGVRLF
jgi:hypothetical protein